MENILHKEIVVINGGGGVGKDTFCDFCSQKVFTKSYSSVAEIKEAAKKLGWLETKENKDRDFLCSLKELSSEYNDFPFNCILSKIESFLFFDNKTSLFFIHIREIEEIKRLKEKYPYIRTLLITNPNILQNYTNPADQNVRYYNYDYIIENDSTKEELQKKAFAFVSKLFE